MNHDPWLEPWASALTAAAAGAPVLEIGCGAGRDTAELGALGLEVFAFDLSPEEAAKAASAAPGATVSVQSVLDPFPLEGTGIGVVVASLSLHYFPWRQTVEIVQRIRSTLRPGGLLLARFNSSEDVNFGALGHPQIEPGLYMVNGQPKRFFSEADVVALFAKGWRQRSRRHGVSLKYGQPKALWEVVVERTDG
jgi:SAM-dependent methyltransferase